MPVFARLGMKHETNHDFYHDCLEYFESLRSSGSADNEFEDEYYFTMPAISR